MNVIHSVTSWVDYLIHVPQNFRGERARDFIDSAPDYPVYAVVLYLLAVFYLPGIMARHGRYYQIKPVVAAWNLFLSVVSTFGTYYTWAMLYEFLFVTRGFHDTACKLVLLNENTKHSASHLHVGSNDGMPSSEAANSTADAAHNRPGLMLSTYYETLLSDNYFGPRAFFMALFMYLKTPELLDTIFLIIQGKPVSFLHWFHHILTAIFCWHASYVLIPSGVFFASMNYFVHSIMYFYYFLVCLGYRSTIRPFAPVITILQVLQMFIGMGITAYTYLHFWLGPSMAGTYFYQAANVLFASTHYVWYQLAGLVTQQRFTPHADVPAFTMSNYFYGCEIDRTNIRMGMMMYGSYCVLFAVLFKELYIDKQPHKNSLVLKRKAEAERKAADAKQKSVTSWVDYLIHVPQNFRGERARDFIDSAPDYPVYAVVLYLLAVFYLPGIMARHGRYYQIKPVVAAWNLFLSVVSTFGTYYTWAMLYDFLSNREFFHSACESISNPDDSVFRFVKASKERGTTMSPLLPEKHFLKHHPALEAAMIERNFDGPRALFAALFAYLKTPELLDTIFLIIQGNPVSFLHWFHHILTAIFCWQTSYVIIPSGLFFIVMNYFVHSIMYFYYFLVCLGYRSTIRPFAPVITILQVLQMFIGMGITAYTYLHFWLGPSMAGTYFYQAANVLFASTHYVWYQLAGLVTQQRFTPHADVPAFTMSNYFYGCETNRTNIRMGMMMYGSYCVLFAVLFKELYIDKQPHKNSLVLKRKAEAERKAADAKQKSVTSWVDYLIHVPQNFRGERARDFIDSAPDYPVYAVVLYLLAVFYLPGIMARHGRYYQIKPVVAAWNLFLSVVSTFGTYYTWAMLYDFLSNREFFHSACESISNPDESVFRFVKTSKERGTTMSPLLPEKQFLKHHPALEAAIIERNYIGPRALFVAVFAYLKTPELLDTIFLIIQGKPVSFLHWFHHILTAIFCWQTSYVIIPSGLFFIVMNYFVHSIMYFYYFLVCLGYRSTIRPFAPVITILQVLQMFIGMGITAYTYLHFWLGPSMAGTYFYQAANVLFASTHYVWYQLAGLVTQQRFTPHADVPAFTMSNYFYGCETNRTNIRMGMMMYGSYCVLFAVLFKELYIDKQPHKNSLVLKRKAEAERKAADAKQKSVTSWVDYLIHVPQNFRGERARDFIDSAPDYPVYAVVLYLLAVFYLPGIMARHGRYYQIKPVVAAWNLFLSVVSTFGTYYTWAMLYEFISRRDIFHSACESISTQDESVFRFVKTSKERGTTMSPLLPEKQFLRNHPAVEAGIIERNYFGPRAFFMALFMYLKTPELLDTIFLIIQGKPVSFLHWFHHILTAIFCWHASHVLIPSGVFFASMNYFVHSIMYFYYFLVCLGYRSTIRPFAPVITILQVLQMFIGMGITAYTYLHFWLGPSMAGTYFYQAANVLFASTHYVWYQLAGLVTQQRFTPHADVPAFTMSNYFYGCETNRTNIRMGMMMYGSYCVLFAVLFKELYIDKQPHKNSLVLKRKAEAERKAADAKQKR